VKELEGEIKKGEIKVTQVRDKLSVNLVEKILFDSGSVEIKPEGLKVLDRVGEILKNVKDKQINVEGYTDNVPIGSKLANKFPTNWELSAARAVNIVRYLEDKVKLDPKLLSASGFAMNRPVASNDSKEGKAQNRRIEIVLLPQDIDQVLEELK
jgi:chemotaxis protein MotB